MIACPACLKEPSALSQTGTWATCECMRLALNCVSGTWQFTDRFGHPDNIMCLSPNGVLWYLKSNDSHYVPENGRAAFVQRFVDRVLTREVMES